MKQWWHGNKRETVPGSGCWPEVLYSFPAQADFLNLNTVLCPRCGGNRRSHRRVICPACGLTWEILPHGGVCDGNSEVRL
jgi:predicted amidophosphoribosyltransferase